MNTAWLVLAVCGPASALGLWMLRNACRSAHGYQARPLRSQAAIHADFAVIVRLFDSTTAVEPPLTRRGRRALARVGRTLR